MIYSQSPNLLSLIQKSKRVLLQVHKNPDLDTVGASTAMQSVLTQFGIKSDIVCPQKLDEKFNFISQASHITTVDYLKINYSEYNLCIVLDTSSMDRITGNKEINLPDSLPLIVIDHHINNVFVNAFHIFDIDASATCEILYHLFHDWNIPISAEIANSLYAGIAGDTVFFKYTTHPEKLFTIASDLLSKGADHNQLLQKMFNSYQFHEVKLLGEFLHRMEYGKNRSFVWSSIPYEVFVEFGSPRAIREIAADLFFQSVDNVDFGVVILEEQKGVLSISFRSKPSSHQDMSRVASRLGGGGHIHASGATVYGKFDEKVSEIIKKISE